MLAVQQQRDRRMAERLLAAPTPALLLAGAFHVRKDLGVPLHLKDLGAGEGNAVLVLAEVGKTVTRRKRGLRVVYGGAAGAGSLRELRR